MLPSKTARAYVVTKGFTPAADTVREIGRLIRGGTADPMVRAWALRILAARGVDGRDDEGIAHALLDWTQRTLPYRRDVHAVELLQTPRALLRGVEAGAPGGDCDDFDVLLGALLQSVGVAVRIVTASYDGIQWNHTFLEAFIRGKGWTALDAANDTAPVGWEQSGALRRRVFDLHGRTIADREGPPDGLSDTSRSAGDMPRFWRGDFFLEGR